MVARVVCFLALCESLAGYAPAVRAPSPAATSRTTPAVMAAPAIIAKKAKVVDEVKAAMADTDLMFCVRSEGIPANDLNAMRQKLPPSVTMRCVKNTLVKRATQDYPKFQGGDELLVYSNFYFFVPADQMRPTVDLWLDYVKVSKKVRVVARPDEAFRRPPRQALGCCTVSGRRLRQAAAVYRACVHRCGQGIAQSLRTRVAAVPIAAADAHTLLSSPRLPRRMNTTSSAASSTVRCSTRKASSRLPSFRRSRS